MANLWDAYRYFKWDERAKKFKPEWWRRAILPYWLTVNITDSVMPITINAAGGAVTPSMHLAQQYGSAEGLDAGLGNPFMARHLVFCDSTDGTAAAAFTIDLRDVGMGRKFMNRPIHVRNFVGTAQLPFRVREPLWFPSLHSLHIQFAKLTGGAVKSRFFMQGSAFYSYDPVLLDFPTERATLHDFIKKWNNRLRYIQPYWLTTDISDVTIPNGSEATYYAKIGDDGCFEMMGMTGVFDRAYTVEISEVETRATLANGAVTDANGVGTGSLPFVFPTPLLVQPGARLKLKFTDRTAGQSDNTGYFCMFGRKIYAPVTDAKQLVRELVAPEAYADMRPQAYPPPQGTM
jgi:hypothetical protein